MQSYNFLNFYGGKEEGSKNNREIYFRLRGQKKSPEIYENQMEPAQVGGEQAGRGNSMCKGHETGTSFLGLRARRPVGKKGDK